MRRAIKAIPSPVTSLFSAPLCWAEPVAEAVGDAVDVDRTAVIPMGVGVVVADVVEFVEVELAPPGIKALAKS